MSQKEHFLRFSLSKHYPVKWIVMPWGTLRPCQCAKIKYMFNLNRQDFKTCCLAILCIFIFRQ